MDTTKEPIRHLSLCSGYEGIGIGLRRVLPNCIEIAHCEVEIFAIANLVAKMEAGEIHPAPVFSNLKEFPFGKFRGCVDILSGGFPCQPFSQAGKRDGVEDPRHLFPYILEGIKECRPSVVFLENVEGIISSKTAEGESVLQHVLRSLEEVGYQTTAGVFSAAEVGAPHQRKRVFIMAYSNSERCEGSKWTGIQKQTGEPSRYRVGQLGNTEHDGQSPTEIRRSTEETGTGNPQGEEEAVESAGASGSQGGGDIQGGERDELANSISVRSRGRIPSGSSGVDSEGSTTPQEGEAGCDIRSEAAGCSGELGSTMAHPNSGRGGEDREQSKLWTAGVEQSPEGTRLRVDQREDGQEWQGTRWPARPNEEQYGWEEQRTVSKPKLGRTPDGAGTTMDPTTNRLDRLRLLGNGVVPATAERAFRVLASRLFSNA